MKLNLKSGLGQTMRIFIPKVGPGYFETDKVKQPKSGPGHFWPDKVKLDSVAMEYGNMH